LTSLNLTGEGQSRLMGLGTFARQTFPRFDFTQAFITPQQKLDFDWRQNLAQWQVQALKNQVLAAPDPNDAALAEGLDNMFKTFSNIGIGMLGGVGGMAGGMGGAGAGATSGTTTQARGASAGQSWFGGV